MCYKSNSEYTLPQILNAPFSETPSKTNPLSPAGPWSFPKEAPPFSMVRIKSRGEGLRIIHDPHSSSNYLCRRVDLATASDEELEHLSNACDPATFGVNQRDVLDESYRKAGKLDSSDFASKFFIGETDLMKVIRPALLEGHDELKPVTAELYKLNVYGWYQRRLVSRLLLIIFVRKRILFQSAQGYPAR
jgi:hypothetical protein